MSTIVTRAGKGSALTHDEVDSNFTNLNTDKYQAGGALGTPASGNLANCTFPTLNQNTTGNSGTVTNGVYTVGNQTIDGVKTFSSTIVGSINGNAATVTNGVYTSNIGSTVQAYSANLDEFATVNPTPAGLSLLDDADAAAQRTTLGLGTAATTASTDYATAAQGTKADSALQSSAIGSTIQAYDSNLTSFVNTFTLPTTDGTSGQTLVTNGSGTLSFSSAGSGTVTSVNMTVPTGLAVSGNPITTSGTLAVAYASGYAIPTTAKQTEWDSAYTQRLQWDGGSTNLVASTGRASLLPSYATNAGKVLAVNTGATDVEWIAVGGSGTVTSVSGTGTVNGITLTGTVTTSGSLTLGGTLSGIGNSQLTNSSITVNGTAISLGASGTITAANPNALTIGTGLSGTSYTGSAAVTIANTGVLSNVAGTGISVSGATGNVTITNTAPDQTVSLTAGTGISTSGTYPSFTITNSLPMTYPGAGISVSTGTAWGTSLTAPTGTIVGTSDSQTLTNKTISADNNTLSGIAASSFVLSNASGNIDGSAAQKVIPAGVVVGTTDSQTLTNKTLTSPVLTTASTTGAFVFGGAIDETVFAVTGTTPALSPSNGTIQTWTLSGNSTPTAGTWNDGESLTLMVLDGTAFTITWTSVAVTWVGGTAPTLDTTKYTVIELWKVGSVIYGALVGAA